MSKKSRKQPICIVLLGPQGSGKGTQAAALAASLRLPHISTGDMFRQHLKYRTTLGRKISKLLDAGTLVPDALTNAVVKERLRRPDCRRGYILDGYPRTLPQAKFLERIARPSLVVALELTDREAVRRLSGRRMAPDGTIYHIKFKPAPQRLRRQLVIRSDDQPAAVKRRLAQYRKQTTPLRRYYQLQKVLAEVDARPAIVKVTTNLLAVVRRYSPTV